MWGNREGGGRAGGGGGMGGRMRACAWELRPWRPNLLLELVDVLQGVGAADDGEVDVE